MTATFVEPTVGKQVTAERQSLATNSLTEPTPGDTMTVTMDAVQSQISQHRSRLRMCGPLSAARALRLLGLRVDPSPWLDRFKDADLEGIPIRDVVNLCREFNSDAVALQDLELSELSFPSILFVNDTRHCIVAQSRVNKDSIRIWDPTLLRTSVLDRAVLDKAWKGEAIVFRQNRAQTTVLSISAIVLCVGCVAGYLRSGRVSVAP